MIIPVHARCLVVEIFFIVSSGTIRRFLEKHGDTIDTVIFVSTGTDEVRMEPRVPTIRSGALITNQLILLVMPIGVLPPNRKPTSRTCRSISRAVRARRNLSPITCPMTSAARTASQSSLSDKSASRANRLCSRGVSHEHRVRCFTTASIVTSCILQTGIISGHLLLVS